MKWTTLLAFLPAAFSSDILEFVPASGLNVTHVGHDVTLVTKMDVGESIPLFGYEQVIFLIFIHPVLSYS